MKKKYEIKDNEKIIRRNQLLIFWTKNPILFLFAGKKNDLLIDITVD